MKKVAISDDGNKIIVNVPYGPFLIGTIKKVKGYGTDLRYIQELLRHNSSKTTEIYTHVSKRAIDKIINPIDEFFE